MSVCIQFELRDATEVLLQDGGFNLELMRVASVLVMAASAFTEVRAFRRDAQGRSLQDVIDASTGEATFLFEQRSFDGLAFENEGQEDGFATAVFIGGQTRQPISAIHEFFDGELQTKTLTTGNTEFHRDSM